jgi:excisionase family DNA binding protein
MNQQPEKLAYTVKEVAAMLSLSRSHLYELIQARKIDTIKIGRARRITRRQLDLYLAEREIEAS